MFGKLTNLNEVPASKMMAAEVRARRENKLVSRQSNDLFFVQASGSYKRPDDFYSVEGKDYHAVQLFESNGELLARCGCPFGTKGEDTDNNVCKHVVSALLLRQATTGKPLSFGMPKPKFARGQIIIDVRDNNLSVNSYTVNSQGAVERTSNGSKLVVDGESTLNAIRGYLQRNYRV